MQRTELPEVLEFEWDKGNSTKSWNKHKVSKREQEETFFSKEKIFIEDIKHSQKEKRFLIFSITKKERKLIVAFTIRSVGKQQKIRPISARPMNKKEVRLYEEAITVA